MDIDSICRKLKNASETLALQTAEQKNEALQCVASAIQKNRPEILKANGLDVQNARSKGMSESLVERLALDDKKIDSILASFEQIIGQTDPVGEETAGWKTPSGMTIRQVRVPLGVVALFMKAVRMLLPMLFLLPTKAEIQSFCADLLLRSIQILRS